MSIFVLVEEQQYRSLNNKSRTPLSGCHLSFALSVSLPFFICHTILVYKIDPTLQALSFSSSFSLITTFDFFRVRFSVSTCPALFYFLALSVLLCLIYYCGYFDSNLQDFVLGAEEFRLERGTTMVKAGTLDLASGVGGKIEKNDVLDAVDK